MLICCNFCGLEDDTDYDEGSAEVSESLMPISRHGDVLVSVAACEPCKQSHLHDPWGAREHLLFGHLAAMTKYVEGGYVMDSTPVAREATP